MNFVADPPPGSVVQFAIYLMVTVDKTIKIPLEAEAVDDRLAGEPPKAEAAFLFGTFLTTTAVFGIFFVQGILLARVLGPEGRGEFGSAVLFAQQLLLYVGLIGGVDIVNRYAKKEGINSTALKYSAISLGLITGIATALVSLVLSAVVFGIFETDKAYLIPFCLLTCLFVPFEHIHLNVCAVDRGTDSYRRYNVNRLLFASVFPLLLLGLYLIGSHNLVGELLLVFVCLIFVFARIVGLLPTLRGLSFRQWLNRSDIPQDVSAPSKRRLIKEGIPYAWSMFAAELFERMDVLLIVLLAPVKEAGFYFVAVPAAALLTIGPNALSVFTFNAGASGRPISLSKAVKVMSTTACFQLVSLALLWFLIPQIIVWVYGSDFEPSIQFVWYLLPACAIKGFLQPLDAYLKGVGKPIVGVWSRITSIVAMLLFVLFAFGSHELYSIPMAACFGQSVSMVIMTTFVILEISNRNRDSEMVT